MRIDLHTHTPLCKHAEGEPSAFLAAAAAAGLSEMGVADHIPWPAGYDSDSRMDPEQFPEYREIVRQLQAADSPVKVLYGIELDWVPGHMDEVYRNIETEPFDYIIGSIHFIDDFGFDSPCYIERWQKYGAQWVWDRYADLILEFAENADFDIIAHADLPKKFGFFPESMNYFMEKIDAALAVAGKKGMAIEINTGGLRKKVKQIYPSLDILKLAKHHGLKLTLGSDAHHPSEVAFGFKEAVELAKAAGFTEQTTYHGRIPKSFPIV